MIPGGSQHWQHKSRTAVNCLQLRKEEYGVFGEVDSLDENVGCPKEMLDGRMSCEEVYDGLILLAG